MAVLHRRRRDHRGRRTVLLGPALLAVALLLSGCTVQAGTAGSVDGVSFSESSVLDRANAYLAENATTATTDLDRAAANRSALTLLLRHQLIATLAGSAKITITNAELQASLGTQTPGDVAAQLGVPKADATDAAKDYLFLEALVSQIPAAGTTISVQGVTLEGVTVSSRDQAVELRSRFVANPAGIQGEIKSAGANGFTKVTIDPISQPGVTTYGIYAAPVGDVGIAQDSTGYLVYHVLSRQRLSTQVTQASFTTAADGSPLGAEARMDLAAVLLTPYANTSSVTVNPRFGVWDPASLQVVEGNDGL